MLQCRQAEIDAVVLVDPERVLQALDKLLENAIQYTLKGGSVRVVAGRQEAQGRVWATVTVKDSGVGIPKDDLPRVFDRFFRGAGDRQIEVSGSGLGLAIAKEVIDLHGGRVTVESGVNVSTAFTVWLPLAN